MYCGRAPAPSSQPEQCCSEWSPQVEVIDHASGDRVCTMCGQVLEGHMMLDMGSYADAERCSDGLAAPGMSTRGVPTGSGGGSTSLQKRIQASVNREEGKERSARQLVERFGRELLLVETTVSWAKEMMADALAKDPVRADAKLRARAAGCLYFACKVEGVDRGENEIADGLRMERSAVQKANKDLRGLLIDKKYARAMLHGVKPSALAPRMLQLVKDSGALPGATEKDMFRYRRRVDEMAVSMEKVYSLRDKKPQSVCAGLIALVLADLGVSVAQVSVACGISQGAVESAVEDLK